VCSLIIGSGISGERCFGSIESGKGGEKMYVDRVVVNQIPLI